MAAATKESQKYERAPMAMTAPHGLVLARIACCGGATRAQIVRDLSPLMSHKHSPGEWREAVSKITASLLDAGLCEETRGRLSATENGHNTADAFLGSKSAKNPLPWPQLRDGRVLARALGLSRVGPTVLKALAQPDGLRAHILQQAWGFKTKAPYTPSSLRAALALVALERAFGNKIKTGLGSGSGFSAKAGRLLAGQLSAKPRDFGTDARLVAALAAESVDARQPEPDALRQAVLRSFVAQNLDNTPETPRAANSKPAAADTAPKAANDRGLPGAGPQAVRRPGPDEFVQHVHEAAETCAEGWAGNRKALISRVWDAIEKRHPGWQLTPIEFKCMLAEAHRAGLLMLASADLKRKESIEDLEASAITYENTVWHLVRLTSDE